MVALLDAGLGVMAAVVRACREAAVNAAHFSPLISALTSTTGRLPAVACVAWRVLPLVSSHWAIAAASAPSEAPSSNSAHVSVVGSRSGSDAPAPPVPVLPRCSPSVRPMLTLGCPHVDGEHAVH
jgi:hypothetical protein